MKEVKSPKRPLIYYYLIVLGMILLFNMIITPLMIQSQIVETDYSTFIQMAEDQELGEVEINETENQIIFQVFRNALSLCVLIMHSENFNACNSTSTRSLGMKFTLSLTYFITLPHATGGAGGCRRGCS